VWSIIMRASGMLLYQPPDSSTLKSDCNNNGFSVALLTEFASLVVVVFLGNPLSADKILTNEIGSTFAEKLQSIISLRYNDVERSANTSDKVIKYKLCSQVYRHPSSII